MTEAKPPKARKSTVLRDSFTISKDEDRVLGALVVYS